MNKKIKELYFTLFLTESEHSFMECEIQEFCDQHKDLELVYYRKFKNRHEPGYREIKLKGNIGKFKSFANGMELLMDNVMRKVPYQGRYVERYLKEIFDKFEKNE